MNFPRLGSQSLAGLASEEPMTRIAYMGGEPMKHKCVIVVALSTFACFGGITTNSPLSLLRSKWGKGSIVDFRKVAYENLPLLFDEGCCCG